MDPPGSGGSPSRGWTVSETHTLLDVIRDMGLAAALTRKGYQNWDVYERLHVILKRCNVRVSSVEIKDRWRSLKVKFWRLKRLVDSGVAPLSGLATDFPYYEEIEHLLVPQKKATSFVREADSTRQEDSGIPSTSLSDSGFLTEEDEMTDGQSRPQEGEMEQDVSREDGELMASSERETQPEGAAAINTEPALGAGLVGALQDELGQLCNSMQQMVSAMERLRASLNHLSGVEEQVSVQLGYVCSLILQMVGQEQNSRNGAQAQEERLSQETIPVAPASRGSSRVLRRSLRRKRPTVRYYV
ncbi:uncharacterized protein O3C94_004388 [Discoglossus pictus]